MPAVPKPSKLNLIWASAGDILDPGDTKYSLGWTPEIPPRQWENYIQNKQDKFISHLNQHGIAQWDAITEYQWTVGGAKSLVMGSNGTIYRALNVNINKDPTTTVGVNWEVAFSNAGDFYTKVEADGLYLAKAQNLADLTNTTTARTNLSVYSQAQTYTKTEVDAKTTVASALQAQAQMSDTVLLSALKLSDALKGGNQSLIANGYQKFPGGLILQWGTAPTTGGDIVITLPIAFPTAILAAYTVGNYTLGSGESGVTSWGTNATSTTQITVRAVTAGLGGRWIALGF